MSRSWTTTSRPYHLLHLFRTIRLRTPSFPRDGGRYGYTVDSFAPCSMYRITLAYQIQELERSNKPLPQESISSNNTCHIFGQYKDHSVRDTMANCAGMESIRVFHRAWLKHCYLQEPTKLPENFGDENLVLASYMIRFLSTSGCLPEQLPAHFL